MRAWQLTERGRPLAHVDLPEPEARPGQVVIDIKAAGLCHTDISFIDGHVPGMPTRLPMVLGHEVAGVISELGEGVKGFSVGDRVGIAPAAVSELGGPGVGRDGGYAERTIGLAEELVPIPEGVSFAQAAAGTDAGATAYHAVKAAGRVGPGTRVGVIGLGGLGQTGARVAVLLGAETYAADVREESRAVAVGLGVRDFFTSADDFAPLGLDIIIDFAGIDTTNQAIAAVKPGGRVVQVGAGKPDTTVSLISLVTHRVELLGSFGGDKADTAAVYDLLATGDLAPVISTLPFDAIDAGLASLRAGTVTGRGVAVRD